MAASLDLPTFFSSVRASPFPGSLTQGQVQGMEAILGAAPPDMPLEHLAYCLGTCPIETAWTMQPIEEIGRGKGRTYGPTGFWGRGYVQLTWEGNYAKATKRLRELGYLTAKQDLVKTPALAMQPDIAAAIMFIGSSEGWFTGKKLSDYLGNGKADWKGARRIINGQDRAGEIALHAQAFAAALKKAGYKPGGVTKAIPTAPVVTKPLPAPKPAAPAPAASDSLAHRIWGRFFGPSNS